MGVVLGGAGDGRSEALLFRGAVRRRPRHGAAARRGCSAAASAARCSPHRAAARSLLFALELPLAWGLRRAGARIEERLRRLFWRKIPRLGDRYFQSRPVSDMAERAHLTHRLRALPTLAADVARVALEIVVVAAALIWLDPAARRWRWSLAAAMLLMPMAVQPALAERDLRMRNHAGALGRFYLDGAAGAVGGADARGGAGAGARARATGSPSGCGRRARALRAALAAEAAQALVGFGLAVAAAGGVLRARAAAAIRAPRCSPSTGRCRCPCWATSWG